MEALYQNSGPNMRFAAFLALLAAFRFATPSDIAPPAAPATEPAQMLDSTVQIKVAIEGERIGSDPMDEIIAALDPDYDPTAPVKTGWSGSGVVYEKTAGALGPIHSHILTANHVLNIPKVGEITDEFGPSIKVTKVEVSLKTHDERMCHLKPLVLGDLEAGDVATGEADCDAGRAVPIAKSVPAVGSEIFISGHSLGWPLALLTKGYTAGWYNNFLSMACNAAPGNSGGPVFYNGEVVSLLVRGSQAYPTLTLGANLGKIWERIQQTPSF